MEKPIINEVFADNGEHSHWQLLDDKGEILWSQDPDDMKTKCGNCDEMVSMVPMGHMCPSCYVDQ